MFCGNSHERFGGMITKVCPLCPKEVGPQPIDNFGLCRSRRDGRNLYCSVHARQQVYAYRQRLRERKQQTVRVRAEVDHLSLIEPERKPLVLWTAKPLTPVERVLEAIKRNKHTRVEIKNETKLHWDSVCDALAILNCEQGVIRFERRNGDAYFFLKKIA